MKVLFLLLCFFSRQGFCQLADSLYWQEDRWLQSEDFLGTPDPTRPTLANSYIGILYSYRVFRGSVTYSARSFFLKGPSWIRGEDHDPAVVAHEQVHFDIAQYFALRLLDTLQTSALPLPGLDSSLETMYAAITQERLQMDRAFDALEKEVWVSVLPQNQFQLWVRRRIQALANQLNIRVYSARFTKQRHFRSGKKP